MRRLIVLAAIAVGALGFPPASSTAPSSADIQSELLQVHFIDVGTGDCVWIHTGDDGIPGNGVLEGLNIVIDGGDWGRFGRADGYLAASEYLGQAERLPFGATIDWLILSHAHSDHNGGLFGFLEDYDVKNILDPGHDKANDDGQPDRERPLSAYGRFFQKASTEILASGDRAQFHWGVPDDLVLNWGAELDVAVLSSSREILDGDLNNTSIVLRLGFSDPASPVSFLFTGDAEGHVEEELVAELGEQLRSTVLKAGHHGSNSSTSEAFLRAVRPAHVVISAGNQAFSGTMLPRPETFTRIETVSTDLSLSTSVWRTDRGDKAPIVRPVGSETGDDTILATSNGQTVSIDYVQPDSTAAPTADRCQATTRAGAQCKRKPTAGSQFCWQHQGE
jgi:competence protein ComEC